MAGRCVAHIVVLLAVLVAGAACTSDPNREDAVSRSIPSAITPSPADPGAAPTNTDQVGVIGDSLTAEMIDFGLLEPALIDAGWGPEDIGMDGVWGRPIDGAGPDSTSNVIQAWRDGGFDPRVWLIALGTNNSGGSISQWQQDIRGVLNAINAGPAGNYTIFWVTTGYQEADANDQDQFLATMQEIAADYPNVVVADYGAFLDKHRKEPDWDSMWSDSVHHSKDGYEQLRTPFYVETLEPESPA